MARRDERGGNYPYRSALEIAAIIQRRYGLPAVPMVVSGTVVDPTSQARVNQLQSGLTRLIPQAREVNNVVWPSQRQTNAARSAERHKLPRRSSRSLTCCAMLGPLRAPATNGRAPVLIMESIIDEELERLGLSFQRRSTPRRIAMPAAFNAGHVAGEGYDYRPGIMRG